VKAHLLSSHAFYNHLSSLPHLKSLDLELRGSKLLQTGNFQGIATNLQLLNHLKDLHVRLQSYPQVLIDDAFLQDLAKTIRHLQKLEHLELFFDYQKITHKKILFLAQSLQQLPHLRVLHINPELDYRSMEILSNIITNMHLTSLILFPFSWVREHSSTSSILSSLTSFWQKKKNLISFFSTLQSLSSLSALSLNFHTFDISNKEFSHFSLALKELKNLSFLRLALPQFDRVNNFEGLKSLLANPKEMKNLNSVHLIFNGVWNGSAVS